MELPDIVLKRIRFLKLYNCLKHEGLYEFVFLDDTWIFQHGTVSHSWQDDNLKTVKSTKVDGKRYIVLHAGNKNGFRPGAELIFNSKTPNSDYHREMNERNFLQWFEHQQLQNLSQPSIIVMDNGSYHSTVVIKIPNSSWTKDAIQDWLTE